MDKLVNLLAFQGLWFGAVLGAAKGSNTFALAGLAAFMILHFFNSTTARADYVLAGLAGLAGLMIETIIVQSGLLMYVGNEAYPELAPAWIVVLWANFALTMNGCLRWLQGRYLLASVLGALGGPLSYFGGIKLGAATAGTSMPIVLAVIAAIYAVATPALLLGARRLPQKFPNV